MPTLIELRQQRGSLVEQMRAIDKRASEANRDLTAEERQEWDRLDKAQDELRQRIEREERMAALEREMNDRPGPQAGGRAAEALQRRDVRALVATPEYDQAFWAHMRGGWDSLNPEQRQLLHEARALSVGVTTAGGFTVPQGFSGQLEASLKFFGGMFEAADVFDTDTGADLPWPTYDDTSNVGALLAENSAETEQDVTFGQITFRAYKYTSKAVRVSLELLQDSAFDLSAELARILGMRIGRITNTHFTTGDNTAKPQGIVTASSVGKTGGTGQTTSVTYNDLVDLMHSIDVAYRTMPGTAWMMNDLTLAAVKKIRDESGGAGVGRPLWEPAIQGPGPDRLFGFPIFVNNDVAVMAANAKSILFGNLKKYKIRRVRNITLMRLVERYADNYQVGFQAFARFDGRMLDAGTDPVKHYANSAT